MTGHPSPARQAPAPTPRPAPHLRQHQHQYNKCCAVADSPNPPLNGNGARDPVLGMLSAQWFGSPPLRLDSGRGHGSPTSEALLQLQSIAKIQRSNSDQVPTLSVSRALAVFYIK